MTSTNTTSTTKRNKPVQLVKQFNELIKRRENWELGAYKASNDQLYEILASAYELYLHLANSTDLSDRKTLANLLKSKNIESQSNTPLHTKVVRLVFATGRQRAYTYGRVLFAARKENIAPSYLPDWIRESGGVEEVKVRSNGQQTRADKIKADTEYASHVLANTKAIALVGKVIDELKPNPEHHPIYSLALIRCDNGQDAEIVWGTKDVTAIDKVLALAGKELRSDAEKKADADAKRVTANTARKAIADAVSHAKRKIKKAQHADTLAA